MVVQRGLKIEYVVINERYSGIILDVRSQWEVDASLDSFLVRVKIRVTIGKHTTEKFCNTSALKQSDRLSPLLFNIALDIFIKEVHIKLDVFPNQVLGRILLYTDDIDTVGWCTTKIKEMFVKIWKETKKVGVNINKEKKSTAKQTQPEWGKTMDTTISKLYKNSTTTKSNRYVYASNQKSCLENRKSEQRDQLSDVKRYGSESWIITKQNK